MGPEAASSGHQIRSMGEGANRKDAPNTNRPPPTKALAICLTTLPNIHNQPPGRNIRLRVAHRAAKGGARARKLSQSAKHMEVIDKENQREPRRVKTEKGGEVKVLIIGATGRTGRILLEGAVEQGHQVTALARNPSAVAPREYRPRVLGGNVLDPEAVEAAVAGQDAVLSALGTRSTKPTTLFSASTANLVDAMKKHGVRRLVCLTGVGAGDSKGHVGFLYDRVFLPLVLRNQYEDKERQEEILRRSGLEWVIVRPARVTNKRATGEYQVFLSGDSYKATTISRQDVADFMLAQLSEDRYVHKTPVISY